MSSAQHNRTIEHTVFIWWGIAPIYTISYGSDEQMYDFEQCNADNANALKIITLAH